MARSLNKNANIKEIKVPEDKTYHFNTKMTKQENKTKKLMDNLPVMFQNDTNLGLVTDTNTNSNSFFNDFQSRAVMTDIKDKDMMFFYDIEAGGTPQHLKTKKSSPVESIREFAFQPTVYDSSSKQFVKTDDNFGSWLVKENSKVTNYWNTIIDNMEKDKDFIHSVSKDDVRSIEDLMLYSNDAKFGNVQFGEYSFKTVKEQAQRGRYKGRALANKENIKKMREGIANLESGTPMEKVAQAFGSITSSYESNVYLGGANVNNYDSPFLFNQMKQAGADSKTMKILAKPQLDITATSSKKHNRQYSKFGAGMTVENMNRVLNNVDNANYHMAYEDVLATHNVANKVMANPITSDTVKNNSTWFGTKSLWGKNGSETYSSGKGFGVFTFDNETGKYKESRTFNESVIKAGDKYELMGQYGGFEFNNEGNNMFGVQLKNHDTGRTHIVASDNINDIQNVFAENLVSTENSRASEKVLRGKQDNARRRYQNITNGEFYKKDSLPSVEIKKIYSVIDELDATKINNPDFSNDEIIRTTMNRVNKNKKLKAPFDLSFNKLEEIEMISDKLKEEKPFWDKVVESAQKESTNRKDYVTPEKMTATQAIEHKVEVEKKVFSSYSKSLENNLPNDTKYIQMPEQVKMKIKGKDSYMETSTDSIRNRISRITNSKEPLSKKSNEIQSLISAYGKETKMSHVEILKMQSMVKENYSTEGKLPQTLVNELASRMSQNGRNSSVDMPTFNIGKSVENSDRALFFGTLDEKKYEGIDKEAKEYIHTKRKQTGKTSMESDDLVLKILEDKESLLSTSFTKEQALIDRSGLITKKKTKNVQEKFSEDLGSMFNNFNKEYNTTLTEEKDVMAFFFSKNKEKDLSSYTAKELRKMKDVYEIPIPLVAEDYTVNIGGNKLINSFKLNNKNSKIEVSSLPERAMKKYASLPNSIESNLKKEKLRGEPRKERDVIQSTLNRVFASIKENNEMKDYMGLAYTDKEKNSNIAKNFFSGTQLDSSIMANLWLEENYPNMHKDYVEKGHGNIPFFNNRDYKNPYYKETGSSLKMKQRFMSEFKEFTESKLSKEYDTSLTMMASSKKTMENYRFKSNPQLLLPGGEGNATFTEVLEKSLNFFAQDSHYGIDTMKEQGLSSTQIRSNTNVSRSPLMQDVVGNMQTGYNMTYEHLNDLEINNRVQQALGKKDKELSMKQTELKGELSKSKSSQSKETIKRLENEISEIENIKIGLNKVSNTSSFDGGAVVSKSAIERFNKEEVFRVKMHSNEEVSDELIKVLQKSEEFNTIFKDNSFDGYQSFTLDKPLDLKDMNLNDGQITVGTIIEDKMKKGSQTAFHNPKDISIIGFDYDEKTGNKSLLYKKDSAIDELGSTKLLIGGHTRASANSLEDNVLKELTSADGIIALPKASKKVSSASIVGSIDMLRNESLLTLDAVANGANIPKDIQYFLDLNKDITVQDLVKEDIQAKYLDSIFKDKLDILGVKDKVSVEDDTRLIIDSDLLTGNKSLLNNSDSLHDFRTQAYEGLGLKDKGLTFQETRFHDTSKYTGTEVKVKSSQKLLDNIKEMYGGDSAVYKSYLNNTSKNTEALSTRRQIVNSLNAEDVTPDRNITLDFNRSFKSSNPDNVMIQDDGSFLVDMTNLKKTTNNMDNLSMQHSSSDIANIPLKIDGKEVTVGSYINEGKSALLHGTLPEDDSIRNKTFPIISSDIHSKFDDDKIMHSDIIKQQTSLISDIESFNNLTYDNTDGKSKDLFDKEKERLANSINSKTTELQESHASYLTRSKKGSQADLIGGEINESAFLTSKTSNLGSQYQQVSPGSKEWKSVGELEEGVLYHNRNNMKKNINRDNIENIIDSFGLEKEITVGSEMSAKSFNEARELLLDNMDTTKKNSQGMYGEGMRFPLNSPGTVQTVKHMIHPDVKESEVMGKIGTYNQFLADFDGDIEGVVFSGYSGSKEESMQILKERKENWSRNQPKLQNEAQETMNELFDEVVSKEKSYRIEQKKLETGFGHLSNTEYKELMGDSYSNLEDSILSKVHEDIFNQMELSSASSSNPFQHIMDNQDLKESGKGLASNYMPRNTNIDEAQKTLSAQAQSLIGLEDNFRRRFESSALDMKELEKLNRGRNTLYDKESVDGLREFLAGISQNLISSKKLDVDNLAPNASLEEQLRVTREVPEHMIEIPRAAEKIKLGKNGEVTGIEQFSDLLLATGSATKEEIESPTFTKHMEMMAGLNELHGKDAKIYSSSGTKNSNILAKSIDNYEDTPYSILRGLKDNVAEELTEKESNAIDIALKSKKAKSNEILERMAFAKENATESILSSLESNSFKSTSSSLETLSDGIDLWNTQKKSRIASIDNNADNIARSMKKNLSNATKSNMATMGVGFAGVWMASALMRKAPTPEGDIAQQEATQVQVNPSALLTAPTARVSDNSEKVTLNISGSGQNMDQSEVANIVNQQVAQMTQSQMNMNINMNDNLGKLNSKWYQDKISSIFQL